MVLNSPWFDRQGAAWLRSPATRVARERLGTTRPMQAIPRRTSEVDGRSLHREHGGEWDYDLEWKPLTSRPIYVGWLRAVRRGHAQLHAGLDIACPTLVLSSARSFFGEQTEETAATHDIVLDVQQIRRWASSVGGHVTSVAIDGAIHDVVLSRPDVRARAYDAIATWLAAWVEPGASEGSGAGGSAAAGAAAGGSAAAGSGSPSAGSAGSGSGSAGSGSDGSGSAGSASPGSASAVTVDGP